MFAPYLTSASTRVLPTSPFLVVIKTTPFAARDPYNAVAVASFKTVIEAISLGSIPLKSASKGIPSTTYNGERLEYAEPKPRIRILALLPGCPEVDITCTPATSPANALDSSVGFFNEICSPPISVAEPVKERLVAPP